MLSEKYRKSGEINATYDYYDVAAGTGIINFYAGAAPTKYSAGIALASSAIISNNKFYSQPIFEKKALADTGAGAAQKAFDIDFDVLVNKPLTLKGTCIVNVPIRLYGTGTTSGSIVAKWRKWDGVTETDIASGTSFIYTATTATYFMTSEYINVPTTLIKRGEYLRLTIEGWYQTTPSRTEGFWIAHDPMGQVNAEWTSTTIPSILTAQLPIKINI